MSSSAVHRNGEYHCAPISISIPPTRIRTRFLDPPSSRARCHAGPRATMSRSAMSARIPCASKGPLPKMTKSSRSSESSSSTCTTRSSPASVTPTASTILQLPARPDHVFPVRLVNPVERHLEPAGAPFLLQPESQIGQRGVDRRHDGDHDNDLCRHHGDVVSSWLAIFSSSSQSLITVFPRTTLTTLCSLNPRMTLDTDSRDRFRKSANSCCGDLITMPSSVSAL